MTSLPWALRRLATARTSKAVSAVKLRAKWLKRTGVVFMRCSVGFCGRRKSGDFRYGNSRCSGSLATSATAILLLRCNRLRQRPHHRGNDVVVHQLLRGLPLIAVRVDEVFERLPSPVIPDREGHAD